MFCLLPFLEEPLVICWELLLSGKSNLIRLTRCIQCLCFKCWHFPFLLYTLWACEWKHTIRKSWKCYCECFVLLFYIINCKCLQVIDQTNVLYSTVEQTCVTLWIMETCPDLHTIFTGSLGYLSLEGRQRKQYGNRCWSGIVSVKIKREMGKQSYEAAGNMRFRGIVKLLGGKEVILTPKNQPQQWPGIHIMWKGRAHTRQTIF